MKYVATLTFVIHAGESDGALALASSIMARLVDAGTIPKDAPLGASIAPVANQYLE